jgi:hypothetical protein
MGASEELDFAWDSDTPFSAASVAVVFGSARFVAGVPPLLRFGMVGRLVLSAWEAFVCLFAPLELVGRVHY